MTQPTQDARRRTQDSITERLRVETRAEHERVEAMVDLLRPDLTLSRYRQWVLAFAGFVIPLEHELTPMIADVVPDAAERVKTPLLMRDLEAIGDLIGGSGFPRCE